MHSCSMDCALGTHRCLAPAAARPCIKAPGTDPQSTWIGLQAQPVVHELGPQLIKGAEQRGAAGAALHGRVAGQRRRRREP